MLEKRGETAADRPLADSPAGRYARSYLFLRFLIGILGFALPIALVSVDRFWFHGNPVPRGSMSIYYYSGMREVFTVTLGTIAFFLFAYRITEKSKENLLSVGAGLAGMLIPLFPTGHPKDPNVVPPVPAPTPIQNWHGETFAASVHYGASFVFITLLGVVCLTFARTEGGRPDHGNLLPQGFWKFFHIGCAGLILVAGIWILATIKIFGHGPLYDARYWSLLLGEWLATAAFGASWLVKGFEYSYVLGHGGTEEAELAVATDAPTVLA